MRRYLAVCGLAAVVGVVGAFGFSPLLKVPFAKQGEPRVIPIAQSKFAGENALATPSLRFPLLAGGTERARGSVPLAKQGQPSLHAVFLVKRGEPHGGGELMTSERAIDMTPAYENPLLKVPPASRGNRTGARLGSPREAGGTLRRGVDNKPRSKDRMPRLTIATVPSTIETVPSPSETVPSLMETVPTTIETVPSTIETLRSAIATIQSGNATPQPSKSHTLGVVLDYPAGDLAAQLSQLKAQGVQELVIRLDALLSREAWQSLLETAEASGLEWRLWLGLWGRLDFRLCSRFPSRSRGNRE